MKIRFRRRPPDPSRAEFVRAVRALHDAISAALFIPQVAAFLERRIERMTETPERPKYNPPKSAAPVSADVVAFNLQTAIDWVKFMGRVEINQLDRIRDAATLFHELEDYFERLQPEPDTEEARLAERVKEYLYS